MAFLIWGLSPLYWKMFSSVDDLSILFWRCVSSLAVVVAAILITKKKIKIKPKLWDVIATVLLLANWYGYVYAVNQGHAVEAGLGYFLAPIMSLGLGFFFFEEKVSFLQMFCGFIVAISIMLSIDGMSVLYSVGIAVTFAAYAVAKKKAPTDLLDGYLFEMIVATMTVPFISTSVLKLPSWNLGLTSGLMTIIPLMLYVKALKSTAMQNVNSLQFLAPSLNVAIGVFYFGEALTVQQMSSYSAIIVCSLIITMSTYLASKKSA